jgi:hypothetical protein
MNRVSTRQLSESQRGGYGKDGVQPTSFIYQNILQQLESVIWRRQLLFQILLQLLQDQYCIEYKRRRTILTLDTTT